MINLNAVLHTDGKGLWSSSKRAVRVTNIEWGYVCASAESGELRVYFDEDTWNTDLHGLVYTDKLFKRELVNLLSDLGIRGDISYSEQGMQGFDYVSFDVVELLISSFNISMVPA